LSASPFQENHFVGAFQDKVVFYDMQTSKLITKQELEIKEAHSLVWDECESSVAG
jgi:hypothetical protein